MKTVFKPANILFYFLSAVVFFFLGMIFAGITNAGKDQGLAVGAIVFGYGVIASFIAFLSSIIVARILQGQYIILINKIFAVIIIILVAFFVYRFLTLKVAADESQGVKFENKIDLTFAAVAQPKLSGKNNTPIGLGMSKPKFYENNVIYFYGDPNFEKSVSDHSPMDSLVFKRTETGIELTYAPPWFVPANLKLDYEILYLRIVSLHRDFVEVIVNETDGRTAYVDGSNCEIIFWPKFLLNVFSVELIDPESNPVRVKPLEHASLVTSQFRFLKPLQINSHWLQVELLDDDYSLLEIGWIKWHENGKLLITYSLLS